MARGPHVLAVKFHQFKNIWNLMKLKSLIDFKLQIENRWRPPRAGGRPPSPDTVAYNSTLHFLGGTGVQRLDSLLRAHACNPRPFLA